MVASTIQRLVDGCLVVFVDIGRLEGCAETLEKMTWQHILFSSLTGDVPSDGVVLGICRTSNKQLHRPKGLNRETRPDANPLTRNSHVCVGSLGQAKLEACN
jgi:hypothetical protein